MSEETISGIGPSSESYGPGHKERKIEQPGRPVDLSHAEAEAEVPEIKMRVEEEDLERWRREQERRELMRAEDSLVEAFSTAKELSTTRAYKRKNKEKMDEQRLKEFENKEKELLEKMEKKEREFMLSGTIKLSPELDLAMEMLSPYPYDTRTMDYWMENQKAYLEEELGSEEITDPEAKRMLNRFYSDVMWFDGAAKLVKGWGTILPSFFSGENMMSVVRAQPRQDPPEHAYKRYFAEELEIEGEEESLRSRGVEMLNESFYWSMAVASVHQMKEDGSMFMEEAITDKEYELINELFGKGEEVVLEGGIKRKEIIENMFGEGSGSDEFMQSYIDRLRALSLVGARERLRGEEGLDVVLREVREKEKELQEKGVLGGVEERMSDMVVKSTIMAMWSHMAVDLTWGYEYQIKEVEKYLTEFAKVQGKKGREPVEEIKDYKRSVDGTGTVMATDAPTPAYWLFSDLKDIKKDWTPSPLHHPSKEMMKKAEEEGPEWAPVVDEDDWSPEIKKVLGDIDKQLLKEVRVWEYETNVKDKKGKNISYQVIIPPNFKSVNFMQALVLPKPEDAAEDYERKRLWEVLSEGRKMSEIPWGENGRHWYYRSMITVSQLLMVAKILRQAPSKANEEDYLKFFGDVDSIREFKKRSDLAGRDEKIPKELFNLGVMGLLIPLWLTHHPEVGRVISGGAIKEELTKYGNKVAVWMEAAEGMKDKEEDFDPDDPHVVDFGGKLVDLMVYYTKKFAQLNNRIRDERTEGVGRMQEMRDRLSRETEIPSGRVNF